VYAHDRLYIGDAWVSAADGGVIDVVSPHTERVMGYAPLATAEDVDSAVVAARAAFDEGPWPRLAPHQRAEYLSALAGAYEPHVDEMAALITEEMGSPISCSQFGQALPGVMIINRRISTGSVGINQYFPDFGAPLGGFKDSGIGREGGTEGIDQYVELQSLLPGVRS
jgi:aldehyde dehydrogenase (NAD+)